MKNQDFTVKNWDTLFDATPAVIEDIEIVVVVIGMTLTMLLSTICCIIGCKIFF